MRPHAPTLGISRGAWRAAMPLAVAMTLGLSACQAPAAVVSAAAPATATPMRARLLLKIDGLYGPRRLLFAPATPRFQIKIEGPDLATPFQEDVDAPAAGQPVALDQVPVGAIRLITVSGLDLAGNVVPGSTFRLAGRLVLGLTTFEVTRNAMATGEVVYQMLGTDAGNHTQVMTQVDFAALAAAVAGYARALHAPDPMLLDPVAIADAVYHANGVPPQQARPAFLLQAGQVEIRPSGWPPGASAVATLDDPLSQPLGLDDDGPHVLGPAAPGKWTLTVTPATPGLLPVTVPVTVTAGGLVQVPLSFGGSQALADLPRPTGAAWYGQVPFGGADGIAVLGGLTTAAAGGPDLASGLQMTTNGLWTPTPDLPSAIADPGSAVFKSRLYGFGGLASDGPLGDVLRFDPADATGDGKIGTLPGGRTGWGMAAGAIGDLIYLAGGTNGTTAIGTTVAFEPNESRWLPDPFPDLAPARADAASVVVDGKLYVFGGATPRKGGNFDAPDDVLPLSDVQAFHPGPPAGWEALPAMPTPRSGAAAIAVGPLVWVIGGAGPNGLPTGAVEVYNTTNKGWSLRPPLQVARAFPAVALVNGKIVVAGGVLGPSPSLDEPVAAVEALAP